MQSDFVDWTLWDNLIAHYRLDGAVAGQTPRAPEVRAKLVDGLPHFKKGKIGQANSFDGKSYIDAGDVADFRFQEDFTLSAWDLPHRSQWRDPQPNFRIDDGNQGLWHLPG